MTEKEIYKCDKCGKETKADKLPESWYLVTLYSQAPKQGAKAGHYHFCKDCKLEVFGKCH